MTGKSTGSHTQGGMLLACVLGEPDANLALELFLRMSRDELGDSLLSVIVYGSALFTDLAPGYGDLDFLAVVAHDLDEPARARLNERRAPLRSGHYGLYCQMIEGAFLPLAMLDPDVRGQALWWGTSGERPRQTNQLGAFVLHTIRERGLVIWGDDVRASIPEVRKADILRQLLAGCADTRGCEETRGRATPASLQSLDYLFTPARELLWLKEGRLSSKSEAAEWGYRNAKGQWRHHLPRARFLRRNPMAAGCRDVQEWLAGLGPAILEATDELEEALNRALAEEGAAPPPNR